MISIDLNNIEHYVDARTDMYINIGYVKAVKDTLASLIALSLILANRTGSQERFKNVLKEMVEETKRITKQFLNEEKQ